jgi:hypothetical protein
MLIEVQGTWLANAGAALMLEATVEAMAREVPGVRFAIDPRWGSFRQRSSLGLLQVFPRRAPGASLLAAVVDAARTVTGPKGSRYLHDYGIVTRSEPDALLDASGFAFSDQWGVAKAVERAERIREYGKRGRPVVLLPQAFGPFEQPGVASAFADVVSIARTVYARDLTSFRHAVSVVGNRRSLRLAPDITIGGPELPSPTGATTGVVIVPNARVLDRGGWDRREYLDALIDVATSLGPVGECTVLAHTDEPADRELVRALVERTHGAPVRISEAKRLKAEIGQADFVIGSRFHALLGALAQGVPVIAVGWSHKYQALLDTFDVSDWALDGPSQLGAACQLAARVHADGRRHRERLLACSAGLRAEVDAMWGEVASAVTR